MIHRLHYDPETSDWLPSLPVGLTIVQNAALDASTLADAYRNKSRTRVSVRLSAGRVAVLSLGPPLFQSDQVSIQAGQWNSDGVFTADIIHTSARLDGTVTFRNVPWRPLVAIPVTERLVPGRTYRAVVTWRAVRSLQDPISHNIPAQTVSTEFLLE